jgi:hypothetical protein
MSHPKNNSLHFRDSYQFPSWVSLVRRNFELSLLFAYSCVSWCGFLSRQHNKFTKN